VFSSSFYLLTSIKIASCASSLDQAGLKPNLAYLDHVGHLSQKFYTGDEEVPKQDVVPKESLQSVLKKDEGGNSGAAELDKIKKKKEECCSCTRFKHVGVIV